MRRGRGRGPITGAAAAITALLVAATPAAAQPAAQPAPSASSAAAGDTVLIVHVAPGRSVRTLVSRLDGLRVRHAFGALHAFSVRVPRAEAAQEAARLRALPGVTAVERSVQRHFTGTASAPTDDPGLARQLGYLDAVRAPQAWTRQHASAQLKIAVVDSGVDVTHPDLAGKVVATYNATDNSADVHDEIGHGTFVAGVAAASTNNGVGVAGAGYDASVYAVKIADADGAIEIDNEVAGIRWAADQHVDVINLSLGGPDRSSAEQAAIAYAQGKGVLVVAAAGNDSDTAREYPASYPDVIAVGATDNGLGTRASFSNHGSWVTVAAPGVGIYSTVPPGGSLLWSPAQSRTGYAAGDGTSFSTPLVTGELALLKAQNPGASAYQLRRAVIRSAHGYAHLGLGAGQVDFVRAQAHVPPATVPSSVTVAGAAGRVRLEAASSASRVAFRIDSDPTLRPVAVSGGAATAAFSTWGYANGAHTLRGYDCTAFDECSYHGRAATFTIANPAPTVTTPGEGATITGRVTIAADNPAGGPLRLLVDGHVRGIAEAAPYRFTVSASDLSDAAHVLAVQGCSADHRRCAGPASLPRTVLSQGLHPRITGLSPARISPNGDRVRDRATLAFTLPQRQDVRVRVLSAAGAVVRTSGLGPLAAGRHTWTWRGLRSDGRRLPDGTYTLALDTASGSRRGWVARVTVVDTRRPALGRPTGNRARVFPYPDGFRDAFTTRARLGDPGRLALTIRSGTGRLIRTIAGSRPAGLARISWDGRDRHGHRVAAGTYRWQLSLTDAAGNVTRSATYRVRVSARRLVHTTAYVTMGGARFTHAGGTARCASARRGDSVFADGLHLENRCASSGFDLAFADYTFRLPAGVGYSGLAFQVRGYSHYRPSEVTAAFSRVDGSVELPRYQKVSRAATRWYTIAGVPAAHHVSRHHRMRVSLLLDSFYRGPNDFDVARVRVRVRMTVLR